MTLQWEMSQDTALEFFKRCGDRSAKTEDERIAILFELAEEGKMTSVSQTSRTKEEIIKDKAKHFNVLHVDAAEGEPDGAY